MCRSKFLNALLAVLLLAIVGVPASASAAEPATIRVGVLQYGTLNWEMEVIRRNELAQKKDLNLEIVPLGSTQALLVALQGGKVDAILGDWIWVARQQAQGRDYYFYPYSVAAGVLVAGADTGIESISDLRGRQIGVAGGEVNKNWILYRAYARKQFGMNLAEDAVVKFAAPPMLNKLVLSDRLDAVINFWHYGSELNAKGLPTVMSLPELIAKLGVSDTVPMLGWLFPKQWAEQHAGTVNRFLELSYQTRELMLNSDEVWEGLDSMQRFTTEGLRARLREAYRQGIPRRFGPVERAAMQELFSILQEESGKKLVGDLEQLPEDIFWTSPALPQ